MIFAYSCTHYLKILSITFLSACGNKYFAVTDMNYFLSALPFLAAVDSGVMGISSDQVLLLPPPKDQTKFCLNVSSCLQSFPETMSKWNAFYQVAFISFIIYFPIIYFFFCIMLFV